MIDTNTPENYRKEYENLKPIFDALRNNPRRQKNIQRIAAMLGERNMPRITLKQYESNEQERIAKMTNRQLYEETLETAQGDDYEGCFTNHGEVTFNVLKAEMGKRLADWLKEE